PHGCARGIASAGTLGRPSTGVQESRSMADREGDAGRASAAARRGSAPRPEPAFEGPEEDRPRGLYRASQETAEPAEIHLSPHACAPAPFARAPRNRDGGALRCRLGMRPPVIEPSKLSRTASTPTNGIRACGANSSAGIDARTHRTWPPILVGRCLGAK